MLLRPAHPAREAAQWSLLQASPWAEAAAEIDPAPAALRLKWPNDLLRHGANVPASWPRLPRPEPPRLAEPRHRGEPHPAPALPDRPTSCLGAAEPPEAFAARLIVRLDHWARRQATGGFARSALLAGARPALGHPSPCGTGPSRAGAFAGLAEDGALLLERDGGLHVLRSGEIERLG
jgi:BirA family biotin operon repressor/biotin-[acetyl-CoA-carboxylase] ligase